MPPCSNQKYLQKQGIMASCGQCLSCRINRSSTWRTRLIHELDAHDDAIVATLTYNDESLKTQAKCYNTSNYSLHKKDLQDYVKRLRTNTKLKFKYFACGEYGETFSRPHYHILFFSLGLKNKKEIEENWHFGHVHLGDQNSNTIVKGEAIGYIAKYITKALTGKYAKEFRAKYNKEPECQLQSQGLGLNYVNKNKHFITTNKMTLEGKPVIVPRYYFKKLNMTYKDLPITAKQKLIIDLDYKYIAKALGVERAKQVASQLQKQSEALPTVIQLKTLKSYLTPNELRLIQPLYKQHERQVILNLEKKLTLEKRDLT